MDDVREVLRQVVLGTPYSSASEFYRWLAPSCYDPAMGEVCVRQTMQVASRLREQGLDVLELFDGRHVAAVVVEEDSYAIADPYLMHIKPIVLHRLSGGCIPHSMTVPTPRMWCPQTRAVLPTILTGLLEQHEGNWRVKIQLNFLNESVIEPIRTFALASQNIFSQSSFEEKIAELLLDSEQTSVSVRVVHEEPFSVTQASLRLDKGGDSKEYRNDLVRITSTLHPKEDQAWNVLTKTIGRSRKDVSAYLVGAARLHADLLHGRRSL